MNVAVTGGAGFIGSHVTDLLVSRGHRVLVIDDFSTGRWENLNKDASLLHCDVCTASDRHLAAFRPEVVIHLAAQVSVERSLADPARDLQVNIAGTANVVMAAARAGARKVVSVSSAAVYGTPATLPLSETSDTRPLTPYGLSKWASERYVQMLSRHFGIAFTILRPANIYGPRQVTDGEGAVVPAFLERFFRGIDPVIHGDGRQTRDFLYVTDMARAVVLAMDHADGETLNVGSGVCTSVLELWQVLAGLTGWLRPPVFGPVRPGDIRHSVLDPAAAVRSLGWTPQVRLTEGLAATVAWTRDHQATS